MSDQQLNPDAVTPTMADMNPCQVQAYPSQGLVPSAFSLLENSHQAWRKPTKHHRGGRRPLATSPS